MPRDQRQEVADLGLELRSESRVQAFSKLPTLGCLDPLGISGDRKSLLRAEDSDNSWCLAFLVVLNGALGLNGVLKQVHLCSVGIFKRSRKVESLFGSPH